MTTETFPPIGSRWRIPDYPGTVYEVIGVLNISEFEEYPCMRARLRTVAAGPDAELGHEFLVESAWFVHRKAT